MAHGTLFISRKFPPAVGGMETLAADLWATLASGSRSDDRLIAHGGSNAAVLLWLPGAVLRLVRSVRRGETVQVLVGDVLLYLLLRPVLVALRVPHATMAMGKDVVWTPAAYQWLVRRVLPRAPLVLAISSATARSVQDVGVPPSRVRVIRLGVAVPDDGPEPAAARAELRRRWSVPDDAAALVTVGRLVRRKGLPWFVEQVLPDVPGVVHLVAGSGPEHERLRTLVEERGLGARVRLLGPVDDAAREVLMRGADAFVQPNVAVPGDMEGFGLVAVEAAMRGALVLAADLEGLRDAVVDGATGDLLPSGDHDAWTAAVAEVATDPGAARRRGAANGARCRELYSRERMGAELRLVLDALADRGAR